MHLFLSAGEPSGDIHGANLVEVLREIDPAIQFSGFGGEKMEKAGVKLIFRLTDLAVMWFWQVLKNIKKFKRLLNEGQSFMAEHRPDAVIVIDYPGFNFQIAKRAAELKIPVYYFVPPQLWAWRSWRIQQMHDWVRLILSALPFEHKWYLERNAKSVFIGHPFFDEVNHQKLDVEFTQSQSMKPGRIVGLFPGSRMQEVKKNFRIMLKTAERVYQQHPDTRFLVASFNEKQAELARTLAKKIEIPLEIHVGRTPEIMELSSVCLSVSGSISLELLHRIKPTVITYKVNRLAYALAKRYMQCKYITLVNLIAERELFPEFLAYNHQDLAMSNQLNDWLENPDKVTSLKNELTQLRDSIAEPGACVRAAKTIMEDLKVLQGSNS
jgi:lipid-A-disaccharide synthase